jgi:hypothetical protein
VKFQFWPALTKSFAPSMGLVTCSSSSCVSGFYDSSSVGGHGGHNLCSSRWVKALRGGLSGNMGPTSHRPSVLQSTPPRVLPYNKQGMCHTVALWFALKSISRQKKTYGNSNISPCKNTTFKKISKRNQNPSRYYNSMTNLNFQHKPKYHLSKNPHIKIGLLIT